jgi:hypothetical protein
MGSVMRRLTVVMFILSFSFLLHGQEGSETQAIWNLYYNADALREAGQYKKALQVISNARDLMLDLDNKRDYFMVEWQHLLIEYLANGARNEFADRHKTLHIIIKNASIENTYDLLSKKIYPHSPPYQYSLNDSEIEQFRVQAAEFDLACTALSKGTILYENDIVVVDSTQKDIALRQISENWYGKDIYLYTTYLDTIEPPLTELFKNNYGNYDCFSIILPASFRNDGNPGLAGRPNETDFMEGGITPQGLPIIPFVHYGDTRAVFINNIDTASGAQLLHEYFHMIEGVIDTGFPGHAWMSDVEGPAGISTEIGYYRHIFEKVVLDKHDTFMFRSKYGTAKVEDTKLFSKVLDFSRKQTQDALRLAFIYYKLGDDPSLEQSLQHVPDYPYSSVLLGERFRYQGRDMEAYQKLKVNAELDPDNVLREMYMGWLLTYSLDLPEYALPYYESLLQKYDQINADWRYYVIDGLAKAYIAMGEFDKAEAIIANDTYSLVFQGNNERSGEQHLLSGIILFRRGLRSEARASFEKAGGIDQSKEYLDVLDVFDSRNQVSFEERLSEIEPSSESQNKRQAYNELIEAGKATETIDEKVAAFYRASLLFPGEWQPWFWIGYYCRNARRYFDALRAFKKMRELDGSDLVQGYYFYYTGMIHHELKNQCEAGKWLSKWVAIQKKAGKEVGPWYSNLLMRYYDTCLSDKQAAYRHALATLAGIDDIGDWYYQRAYIWCKENGFAVPEMSAYSIEDGR